MSFKYINPGYANLTIINDLTAIATIQDPSKSRTGVAYSNSVKNNYVWISPIAFASKGVEFWIKFDFYWNASSSRKIYLSIGYPGSTTITCYFNLYSNGDGGEIVLGDSYGARNWSVNTLQEVTGLRPNAINTAWFHFITSSRYGSDGCIELQLNQKKLSTNSTSAYVEGSGYDYQKITLYDTYNGTSFSSILFSDEYLSPNERVVLLPVSSTVTDMESLQSGLYVADTASETLLQAVDTSALIQEYGSDTNVTGIALIGNPAYQVDDVIGNITALTKQNNVITDIEKITLSTSTDAMISSSFLMPTDTTITDLSNIQFGWRAEE